jgi:purine operon repressor
MKRTERIGAIIKILSNAPNVSFPLSFFCEKLSAAKSSISEDLQYAGNILKNLEMGKIETTSGASGGVRYIPFIGEKATKELQDELCMKLKDKNRILTGGFLYTSDIMYDANLINRAAEVFARKMGDLGADYVATIETKGIPIAFATANYLNLPLVVIRRESKISEGSTVSINYFSGSSERIQKMSIAKRAVESGKKAIIIDDFMRAGGSVKGISDILHEFGVETVGTCVMISTIQPKTKKVDDFTPLVYLGQVDEKTGLIDAVPNKSFFSKNHL